MAETPSKIRIAIIGAGVIGPRHALAVQSNPDTTLSCFVDPNPAAQAAADSFKVPLHTSIEALLSSSTPFDAAIICTPNDLHVSNILTLLSSRPHLPILVEKPLSTSLASAAPLLTHLKANPSTTATILVGHHRRFNPSILSTKRILDSSRLGTILAITGTWTTLKPPSYFTGPNTWRATPTAGGPIRINLIHDMDCLQHLLGPIVRVSAEATVPTRSTASGVEEGAAILLRFASGVVGTFLLCDAVVSARNFESGTGENPHIPRAEGGRGEFYRFFGTEGSLSVPGGLEVYANGEGERGWGRRVVCEEAEVEDGVVPFERQMSHFVRVCRGEEAPGCTVPEALGAVAVCEAVKTAMETGVAVEVQKVS